MSRFQWLFWIRLMIIFEGEPRECDIFGDWSIEVCEQEEIELGMSLQEQFDFHGSFDS